MSAASRLPVVLCWHMHQPHYADPLTQVYQLPWVYLHAIKDYVDMAAHLEAQPGARAVVNFAPTLLEQIDDYATQVREYLDRGTELRDPLLVLLATGECPDDIQKRAALIRALLRANRKRMIDPFPPFRRIADLAERMLASPRDALYLNRQFFVDLVVWYHIAWLGETVRREDRRVRTLLDRGCNFTDQDRRLLLSLIGDLLAGVLPRYRVLAEAGKVELSVTPYAHSIAPLLLDLQSASEAMPGVELPDVPSYPDGESRVQWHIERGCQLFEEHFGRRPEGCWPAEGGVSTATLRMLGEAGFRWCASGENVLRHSRHHLGLAADDTTKRWLHRPYRIDASAAACFFRDDGLSDLIGFTYADWHADDAVADLINHLLRIEAETREIADRCVSIILDGENAWEYYPNNGHYFLSALYRRLADHPQLLLSTFSDQLATAEPHERLAGVVAGSWVYGTFSTWIGDPAKNRGWEMLVAAKQAFDGEVANGRLVGTAREQAERQLAICEGSDWFWWFGDYNPADSVADFERLFRRQLSTLYRLLQVPAPEYLDRPFTQGGGAPAGGGVMRSGKSPEP